MHKTTQQIGKIKLRCKSKAIAVAVAAVIANCVVFQTAHGIELVNTDDLKVRWDNTLKYTAAWRMASPNGIIANQNGNWANTAFGDLGYSKGDMVNNRADLLSEFDVSYKNIGGRISGSAWYDNVYAKGTNNFKGTASQFNPNSNTQAQWNGGPVNVLNPAAKDIMGQHAEIDDAFVFGKFDLDDHNLTVRAGKHTVIYGESLFLGANAVAGAQGPVDIIKAWSMPNAQFKEVAMPVNQISGSLSLTPDVSVGAYYQFQWKSLRFPGYGSFLSPASILGDGSDFAVLANGGVGVSRGADFSGKDSGQFGAQVKFAVGDFEYGLYAARYDDKAPILTLNMNTFVPPGPGPAALTYNMMYQQDIKVYGASFSTVVSGTNIAGEISNRRNVALAAPGDAFLSVNGMDNQNNTPYDRGNSLHMNLSTITIFGGSALWDASSLVAEYAFNRLDSITYTAPSISAMFAPTPLGPLVGALAPFGVNPAHTRDAQFIRLSFSPQYFNVRPGVDLTIPMGVGYGLSGRSAVLQLMPEHGGDFNIGVNAEIDRTWRASLTYIGYFGNSGNANGTQLPLGTTPLAGTYQNSFADRNFISASIQRTF